MHGVSESDRMRKQYNAMMRAIEVMPKVCYGVGSMQEAWRGERGGRNMFIEGVLMCFYGW